MYTILDCTLRDGGYYTGWDFDSSLVSDYLETMASLPISHVEIGYRSNPKNSYFGQFFYLPTDTLRYAKSKLRGDQFLVIMLNAKDCVEGDIEPLLGSARGLVDIVRFACPPNDIPRCILLAREVKRLGFGVAINVMYLHQYANDISPLGPLAEAFDCVDIVALVDSYGSCSPVDVEKAVRSCVDRLPQKIGFHGHDNISLAYANAIAAISAGATLIDATIAGMGRGAGNLTTELAVSRFEKDTGTTVRYAKLAHLLENFTQMKFSYGWGSSLPYMISGLNNLPQAKVMDWLSTNRYASSSIVSALKDNSDQVYDRRVFPKLNTYKHALGITKRALIVGGGESARNLSNEVSQFVDLFSPVIIHASLRNASCFNKLNLNVNQLYCLPGQEASRRIGEQDKEQFSDAIWITTQAPRFEGAVPTIGSAYEVGIPSEFEAASIGPVSDVAPIEMALSAAKELGCEEIYLIGCEGYSLTSESERKAMSEVERAFDWMKSTAPNVKITSLTRTAYNVPVASIFSYIQR